MAARPEAGRGNLGGVIESPHISREPPHDRQTASHLAVTGRAAGPGQGRLHRHGVLVVGLQVADEASQHSAGLGEPIAEGTAHAQIAIEMVREGGHGWRSWGQGRTTNTSEARSTFA